MISNPVHGECLTTVGLFSGIGGIELGLHQAGHAPLMLCEIMPAAVRVLESKREFSRARIEGDVRLLTGICRRRELDKRFPPADVVSAGFPCQDLSQAGGTAGIHGANSGLVSHLLDLLSRRPKSPRWVLIENVPFMLQLDRGGAMSYLTEELESLGFRWAYRVVDSRSFGIPQRRLRVVLVASRTEDPRNVLFADEAPPIARCQRPNTLCGFYWTEGNRGIGWAIDAVPTLKGSSTVGIPSPPAIWFPKRDLLATPDIRDAERFQGFPVGWTVDAVDDPTKRNGPRWRLVGNAVTVDLGRWVGQRLRNPGSFDANRASASRPGRWPQAAYGEPDGKFWTIDISAFPVNEPYQALGGFLSHKTTPLSARATRGFMERFKRSPLRKPPGFLESMSRHLASQERSEASTCA